MAMVTVGVSKFENGWGYLCSNCEATNAAPLASRDAAREAYAAHRKGCLSAGATDDSAVATADTPQVTDKPKEEPPMARRSKAAGTGKKRTVKKASKKRTAKKATKKKATGARKKVDVITAPRDKKKAAALFAKLVRDSATLEAAWTAIHKAFPRDHWGKVRDITRKLTEHNTFSHAFAVMRQK